MSKRSPVSTVALFALGGCLGAWLTAVATLVVLVGVVLFARGRFDVVQVGQGSVEPAPRAERVAPERDVAEATAPADSGARAGRGTAPAESEVPRFATSRTPFSGDDSLSLTPMSPRNEGRGATPVSPSDDFRRPTPISPRGDAPRQTPIVPRDDDRAGIVPPPPPEISRDPDAFAEYPDPNITEPFQPLRVEEIDAGDRYDGPRLAIEGLNEAWSFSFGTVEADTVVTRTIGLRNVGSEDLLISRIHPSCPCIGLTLSGESADREGWLDEPLVIEPGDIAPLEISVDTSLRRAYLPGVSEGEVIQVYSSDPHTEIFFPDDETSYEIRFRAVFMVPPSLEDLVTPEPETF